MGVDSKTIEADKISAVNINSKEKLKENVRKPGIISDRIEQKADDINIDFMEKASAASELIRKAIKNNDFLNNMMDNERLEIVINAMTPRTLTENSFVVNEGENGSHFYVSARGQFQVIKDGEIKTTFGPGVVFGELAILYKAKRFASIKVTTEGMVWALERKIFQKIMMKTGSQEREQNIKFLQTVKVLEGLPTSTLHKVADLLKRVSIGDFLLCVFFLIIIIVYIYRNFMQPIQQLYVKVIQVINFILFVVAV